MIVSDSSVTGYGNSEFDVTIPYREGISGPLVCFLRSLLS